MARKNSSSRRLTVAITGATSGLGELLLPLLLSDERVEKVRVLDVAPPPQSHPRVEFHRVDLTRPDAGDALQAALRTGQVDALYHLAFIWGAGRNPSYAHDLEVLGTLHVLSAVAAVGVGRLVLPSLTALYGAQKQSPCLLRETAPLLGCPTSRFISDKVEVERQVRTFRREHPETQVLVLRFAPVLGPNSDNPAVRLLRGKVVPTLLGFDPAWQAVHEDDAARALHLALSTGAEGDFNIVGRGVLPLSGLVEVAGGRSLPVPSSVARSVIRMLSAAGVMRLPLSLIDYLHYAWVADGERAERELSFFARHHVRDAALALRRI